MNQDLFASSPLGIVNTEANEDEILDEIRRRVTQLLDENPELLFSYLYRLDVEEHKIKEAMSIPELTADQALAHLIWERQKQRLKTRQEYRDKNET